MPDSPAGTESVRPVSRPSSLVSRARQASALLEQLNEEQDASQHRNRYGDTAAELADPAGKLAAWPAILATYRQRDASLDVDAASILKVRTAALEVAEAYETVPASILNMTTTVRDRFWNPLRQLPGRLDLARNAAWANFCDRTLPPLPEQRLNVLAPVASRRVASIRGLHAQAMDLRRRPGSRVQDFDRFTTLAKEISDALNTLGVELPDELFAFINEATSPSGADLAKLTDTIREGLAQLNLEHLLRVHLNAPDGRRP